MALLPLVIAPDPRLKTKSEPVAAVTEEIRMLAFDMLETMYHERGVGLAAVQVGVLMRLIVADVDWREEEQGKQWVFINPEILELSDKPHTYKEGCLSFPDQFADVERPERVRVRFTDLDGQVREKTFTGLLATCVQHEIDHINGITFVDHISRIKKDMILRKLQKLKKAGAFDHDHDHVHGEHCNHG